MTDTKRILVVASSCAIQRQTLSMLELSGYWDRVIQMSEMSEQHQSEVALIIRDSLEPTSSLGSVAGSVPTVLSPTELTPAEVGPFLEKVAQFIPPSACEPEGLTQEMDGFRYRSIFNRLGDAVLLIDAKTHRIIAANQTATEIYEYSHDELIGRSLLELLPIDQHQDVWENSKRMLSEPTGIRSTVKRTHVGKSGRELRVSVSASLIELEGRLVFQDVIRDETARIQLEEGLSVASQSLRETNHSLRAEIDRRKQVEQELRDEGTYLQSLLTRTELERRALSYEIHDTAIQNLAASIMFLESIKSSPGKDSAKTVLDRARLLMNRSLDELRSIMFGLRPSIIDDGDLNAVVHLAINEHLELGGQSVSLKSDLVEGDRHSNQKKATVFRILQEGLKNVRQHSQATSVAVEVANSEDGLKVAIEDSGIGFNANLASRTSFGLRGIQERARLHEGSAKVVSRPGEGTKIRVDLPAHTAAPKQCGAT